MPFRLLLAALLPAAALAQQPGEPDPEVLKEKMKALSFMDGQWRGTATTVGRGGVKTELTQTERVGPHLDGIIRVVEGRGYDAGGETVFNAFAVISYDPGKDAYLMKSYTGGRSGEFEIVLTDDGFEWAIPAGPGKVQYRATFTEDTWTETGEMVFPGRDPLPIFEMNLKRIGDTDWPAGDPVPTK